MPGECPGHDETGLDEEGPQRMLERGDRTGGVGKGGVEMGQDVRRRSERGLCRQLGRRAARRQCRADLALAVLEAFPDAQQGPVTERAVDAADGGEDADDGSALEEPPQSGGGEAEASDLVGEPDAERPAAAMPCIAVAAKDPPGAYGLSLGAALVIAAQIAVANQRADHLAVWTGRLLKPFRNRDPFLGAAEEPSLLAHAALPPRKAVILPAWGRGGVVAGYEKAPLSGVRGKKSGAGRLPNSRCNNHPPIEGQFGNIQPTMRSERGKGQLSLPT